MCPLGLVIIPPTFESAHFGVEEAHERLGEVGPVPEMAMSQEAVSVLPRDIVLALEDDDCRRIYLVEFFAETQAKPVKTLKSIDEENERLRNLVTRLQDRVATLETIATDPAERTAREIESLRALPLAEDGTEN